MSPVIRQQLFCGQGIHTVVPQSGNGQTSSSSSSNTRSGKALASLDMLLGSDSEDAPSSSQRSVSPPEGKMVEWWKVKPRQAAPPRQTAMSSGTQGRFIMNEDLMPGGLSVGRVTGEGTEVALPRVMPVASWAIFAVCAIVYGTYVNVGALQSPDSAQELLSGLLNDHTKVLRDGEAWRLAVSQLAHGSPMQLVASLWGLATLAPEVEAVMGYTPFAATFMLSGLTGAAVAALSDPAGLSCGPTAALMVHRVTTIRALRDAEAMSKAPPLSSDLPSEFDLASSDLGPATSSIPSQPPAAPTPTQALAPSPAGLDGKDLVLAAHSLGCIGLAVAATQLAPDAPSVEVSALAAGLVAGGVLAVGLGPQYQVSRELDIPIGSMTIPQDAKEFVVVVDMRSSLQRAVTALAYAGSLAAAFTFASSFVH